MTSYLHKTLLHTIRNTRYYYTKSKTFEQFCVTWKEKFANVLNHPTDATKETWENMRKYVMESGEKPQIVDSYILLMCKQAKCPDVGINYYKFLESNNYNPTVSTIGLYLQLYKFKNDPITKADRDHILKIYNYITSQYQSFDSTMSNILVIALCKIDEWREAIKVIEKFEVVDNNFLRNGYNILIECLFNCGEIDLAYKYLINSIKTGIGPSDEAYSAYIMYCLKERDKFKERLEILFNLWNKYGIKPSESTVGEFITICNNNGWSARLTTITSLTCSTCKKNLKQTDLTEDEYKRLEKAVLHKLILKNIYYVTDPYEIERYMKFIDENKPYDVIIDGLNLMCNLYLGFRMLEKHLTYYKEKNKKVLVIGKSHTKKKIEMKNLERFADFFFVHNWSHDDLFILYAAFSSGQNTIILSNDFMRQHKRALGNVELDTLFKKWQASHHYVSKFGSGYTTLSSEVQIDSIVQKQDNCWHIPYMSDNLLPRAKHTCTSDWACFNMCPQ